MIVGINTYEKEHPYYNAFTTVIIPMKAQRWTSQMSIGRDSGSTAARRGRGTSSMIENAVRRLRDRLRCRSGIE